jgi:biotin synthase
MQFTGLRHFLCKFIWDSWQKRVNSAMDHVQNILDQAFLSRTDILRLLSIEDQNEQDLLFRSADAVTRHYFGKGVYLRGIIEISNVCRRNCSYCGIRSANDSLPRYRMKVDEILDAVAEIRDAGIRTVVLQSGEDPHYSPDIIEECIRTIKKRDRMAVTLSLGEYPYEVYRRWHKAGADRYLLKFETSDPSLYRQLHPDCNFDERWRCLRDIRRAGYQLGSGFMVGLPGQTPEILVNDLLALAELEPDMAGIGPFISHSQTPLHQAPNGDPLLALRVLAVARLLLKDTHLPTTTALETLEHDSRVRGLKAGANVIMPNFTPLKYKRYYDIYPNKVGSNASPESSLQLILDQIRLADKHVEAGYGHSLKSVAGKGKPGTA